MLTELLTYVQAESLTHHHGLLIEWNAALNLCARLLSLGYVGA